MIRRYTEKDLFDCAIILKDAFAQTPWNEAWSVELAETRIKELMCSPVSIGYVYEESGNIKGMIAGRKTTYLHGKEYFIDEFFISPSAQRKGVGSQMISFVKKELSSLGFVDMVLNTSKGFPSERFYLKNGFMQRENMIFMYLEF